MERQAVLRRRRLLVLAGGAGAILWLSRDVLSALAVQLAGGYVLMSLALPLCRVLEKRLSPGWAAGLSFLGLGVMAAGLMLGIIPTLAAQLKQLTTSFPALLHWRKAG